MTCDKFNCKINKGDWVLYTPIDPDYPGGPRILYRQIEKISQGLGSEMVFIDLVDEKHFTLPHLCVKFSQEEYTMRKLESKI